MQRFWAEFQTRFYQLRDLYATRRLALQVALLTNPRTFSELLRTAHRKPWVL